MSSPRREPWPIALAAALLSVIGVMLGFWWVAVQNPVALVSDDAFAAGSLYNQELVQRGNALARGWELALEARPGAGEVHVEVTLQSNDATRSPRVQLRREHPSRGGWDRDFELAPQAGSWVGVIPLPVAGRWRLVARATDADARLERAFALEMP